MAVIPITLSISLGLVILFSTLFWYERRKPRVGSAERDSLQPFADEARRIEEDVP